MKYNELGKTGLKASEIGFGAEWVEELERNEVKDLMEYCSSKGINIIDIWNVNPQTRSKLGYALKGNRDKWIIQGHIGATWQNNQYVRTREMDKVVHAFEDLIERLDVDFLDFGMIHYVDGIKEYEEIMNGEFIEYVRKLKKDKIIHHIGLSTHNPDIALLAANSGEIELIMFSINPAYDMFPATEDNSIYKDEEYYEKDFFGIDPKRAEVYQTCEENKVAITAMKTFCGGRLLTDESQFGVKLTPTQCISYSLERPGVCSILVGMSNLNEVDSAMKFEIATDEEKDYIKTLCSAPKHSFEGECCYCGHCAPCNESIDIAAVNKYYDLAKIHDKIPDTVKDHYLSLEFTAKDCVACGECMERCPFNVDIIAQMENAKELFEQ